MAAHVLINGLQLMNCSLPTESEGKCSVFTEVTGNLIVMPDYGECELSFVLWGTLPNNDLQTSDPPWSAQMVVNESIVFSLGRLPVAPGPEGEQQPTVLVRFVPKAPTSFTFSVLYDPAASSLGHPDEDLLVKEMILLLQDETLYPRGCSVASTNVSNRLRDLNVYRRVIHNFYRGEWGAFLSNHGDIVKKVLGKERRLVLAEYAETCAQADEEFAEAEKEKDEQLSVMLAAFLQDEDKDYGEVLAEMLKFPAFENQLTPSSTMVTRFLQSHRELFWVKTDEPIHTTRVGLVEKEEYAHHSF